MKIQNINPIEIKEMLNISDKLTIRNGYSKAQK
jgi:hypothetical protein